MKHRFETVDVFTDRPFGGNPLAVVLDAEGLSTERMQAIAAELAVGEDVDGGELEFHDFKSATGR